MDMVKIQLRGERGKKILGDMIARGRAYLLLGNVYVIPESALEILAKIHAEFRELRTVSTDSFPEIPKPMSELEHLERHCGKLVVQKVGQGEAVAIDHLRHPKPKYRYAALRLIDLRWGPTQDAADACEEMAVSDSEIAIRQTAAFMLGRYYSASGNMRIANLLARIVSNRGENAFVREAAYWALCSVPEAYTYSRPNILEFGFPDDVDWAFVEFFIRQNTIKRWFRLAWLTVVRWIKQMTRGTRSRLPSTAICPRPFFELQD